MADRIGIAERVALRMFYDAWFNDPIGLENAVAAIRQMNQPAVGYVYADEVPAAIENLMAEVM